MWDEPQAQELEKENNIQLTCDFGGGGGGGCHLQLFYCLLSFLICYMSKF